MYCIINYMDCTCIVEIQPSFHPLKDNIHDILYQWHHTSIAFTFWVHFVLYTVLWNKRKETGPWKMHRWKALSLLTSILQKYYHIREFWDTFKRWQRDYAVDILPSKTVVSITLPYHLNYTWFNNKNYIARKPHRLWPI